VRRFLALLVSLLTVFQMANAAGNPARMCCDQCDEMVMACATSACSLCAATPAVPAGLHRVPSLVPAHTVTPVETPPEAARAAEIWRPPQHGLS
jgi:hypothetical protein